MLSGHTLTPTRNDPAYPARANAARHTMYRLLERTARPLARLLLAALILLAVCAQAALPSALTGATSESGADEFLPVREAFRLTIARDDQGFIARWQIADGYYLYRDKFHFALVDNQGMAITALGTPQSPAGQFKNDEIFGRVEIYQTQVDVRLPLNVIPQQPATATLKITYQGCAEAGLCYPPETETWPVDFTGMSPATATTANTATNSTTPAASDAGAITRFLANASFAAIIGTFLLLGIGLAFTPCVLPMVPILSSIIVGEGHGISTRRAFMLSVAYVLGMALTYTAAGVAVGFLGAQANVSMLLQSPPVLIVFTLVFVALAMSMFGFYELQVPAFLRDKLSSVSGRQKSGRLLSVAVMGAVSALVVSPCVSAPLAGALVFISTTGDAVLGGTALFALAMGMGFPLLLIGTSGGKLLPKAGAWMNGVKAFFGVMLLGIAIILVGRILPGWASLALWGSLLMVSAIYLKALEPLSTAATGWAHFRKGVGMVLMLLGATLLIGAAGGANDPLEPLGFLKASAASGTAPQQAPLFTRVKDSNELTAKLADARTAGKPVMLDFFAEWCVACKLMERDVFAKTSVHNALAGYVVLQVDATDNNDTNQALLAQYNVMGLPSILFFRPDGTELKDERIQGEQTEAGFVAYLRDRIEPKLR